MFMHDVVRLADHYLDGRNPEAIDRQGRLFSCIALVAVFHIVLSIAFTKLQEIEKRHRLYHPGPSITYDLMIAPPAVHKQIEPPMPEPQPIALQQGKTNVGGSASAPKHSEQLEIPKPIPIPQPQFSKVGDPVAPPPLEPAKPVTENNQGSIVDNGQGALGKDKVGALGDGDGQGSTIGGGTQLAFAGGDPVPVPEPEPALRDIAPYRRAMLISLAEVWRPKRDDWLVVVVNLAPDGSVLKADVERTSSDGAIKRLAKALERVHFNPLPDWYHGKSLPVRLHLNAPDQ